MALADHLPERAFVREHWPLFVGLVVIVVGHVYYYGWLQADWQPASPPLLLAVLVVILLEIARSLYGRYQQANEPQ